MVTTFKFYAFFIFPSTILISFFCITTNTVAVNPRSLRFNVELIHLDSPLSPFQNPNTILSKKALKAQESSIARYTFLTSQTTSYIDVIPYGSLDYLAKIPLGGPASDIFITIDTSSGILWIQCKTCLQCFDHTKSSTYTNMSCKSSSHCKFAPNGHCRESSNGCTYHIQYGDQDENFGYLASDSLAFINSDGGVEVTIMNLVFVCGIKNNKFMLQDQSTGVLGLAAMNLSIVSQLSSISQSKFSYCFGNLSDPSSRGNLIFGDAHISGFTTPFVFDHFYYLSLIDISVGSQKLNIPSGTFDRKDSDSSLGSGGVIIDSGTPLTILAKEGYNELIDELSVYLLRFKCYSVPFAKSNRFCSYGSFIRDLNGFPTVTFHFKDNANLVLGKWSLFTQVEEDVFCLNFLPSDSTDVSVIGNMAQQFYNFGFDLVKNELSFIQTKCII
ncbi:aspartic proteinase CDR1-like [Macadamia integrifolia]|uniref:aspartic proteinase CDR1-like n=1 Tax=Macadamia integrifolia TaxID=60698 RepID=UPI001C5295E7|nr:aspartic proteinase CDR1-like [Macadamia integrifolia]